MERVYLHIDYKPVWKTVSGIMDEIEAVSKLPQFDAQEEVLNRLTRRLFREMGPWHEDVDEIEFPTGLRVTRPLDSDDRWHELKTADQLDPFG